MIIIIIYNQVIVMGIFIDARLEQPSPRIYLRSVVNGQILMSWNSYQVNQWLENGDISYDELNSLSFTWRDLLAATRE